MRKIPVLLFILLFIGCNASSIDHRWQDIPIKLKVQNEYQQEAVDFYNALFPGVTLFVDSNDPDAVAVESFEKGVLLKDKTQQESDGIAGICYTNFDGNGYIYKGEIRLISYYYDTRNTTKILMAHELMHLLGYAHHDDDGIMMPNCQFYFQISDGFGDNLKDWIVESYHLNPAFLSRSSTE